MCSSNTAHLISVSGVYLIALLPLLLGFQKSGKKVIDFAGSHRGTVEARSDQNPSLPRTYIPTVLPSCSNVSPPLLCPYPTLQKHLKQEMLLSRRLFYLAFAIWIMLSFFPMRVF